MLKRLEIIQQNEYNIDWSECGEMHFCNTMVPLRAVAEKMGYTVDWDGEKQAVTVGNDTWEIVLHIGLDSYVGVTKIKDAVGMTAPQSYGTAPKIIEDTTFVPAKMFELMGYQYSTIGQFVNFEDMRNPVQIPSPFAVTAVLRKRL